MLINLLAYQSKVVVERALQGIPFVAVAISVRTVVDMIVVDTEAGVPDSESALFCVAIVTAEIKAVPLFVAGYKQHVM